MQTRKMIFADELKQKLNLNPRNSFISISAVEAIINDCSFLDVNPEIITGVDPLKECIQKNSVTANLCPCFIEHEKKIYKALFHRWVEKNEYIFSKGKNELCLFALVELENGMLKQVVPHLIQFIDTAEIMKEYNFDEYKEV